MALLGLCSKEKPPEGGLVFAICLRLGCDALTSAIRHEANACEAEKEHHPSRGFGNASHDMFGTVWGDIRYERSVNTSNGTLAGKFLHERPPVDSPC
jgi:hypothetical protein